MEGSRIAKKILALLLVAVIALGCGFGGAVLAAKYYNQPNTQAQSRLCPRERQRPRILLRIRIRKP